MSLNPLPLPSAAEAEELQDFCGFYIALFPYRSIKIGHSMEQNWSKLSRRKMVKETF